MDIEGRIREHSKHITSVLEKLVKRAGSEEDVRHGFNKLIDTFVDETGLKIEGKHEYALAGGRVDSKYGAVIIEYKDPNRADRLGESLSASGSKAVVEQLRRRFSDFNAKERVTLDRLFGMGTDGQRIIFVRSRGGEVVPESPLAVTPYSIERLLRALVSVGARRIPLTPDSLAEHFGSQSDTAQQGVRNFYRCMMSTRNTKAQTFFQQWRIHFGEVCGYDVEGRNPKIKALGDHYEIKDARPAEMLFAVHTYYAVFMKFLAAEIVAGVSPVGVSILRRCEAAPTASMLRDQLEKLEHGGIWKELGITNFLEGDLFSWYLDAWDEHVAESVRGIVGQLGQFDPTTLSVEPSEARDLLKQLYLRLFPRSVRHDLGEYYTPDWLAELVLNELEYDGNPDRRVLDPACGSGTFLVMAVNRVRAWFDEHRHDCGFQEGELVGKILGNIIGFDLNPLAVMAARTNYLLAIRDLLRFAPAVELPVYMCDSIMTPAEYGGIDVGDLSKARRLPNTVVGEFIIPSEIASDRTLIGRYADVLEYGVQNKLDDQEFIDQCLRRGLPVAEKKLHTQLFRTLLKLDQERRNGMWARIIKNAFAPLFTGRVDFVVGNPPWINWENLPGDYREQMKGMWAHYGLFTLSGSAARLGGGKKDLSMLFLYTGVDRYLETGGRLGFVITQTVFKTSGAGEGFRRFQFARDGRMVTIKPLRVHDLSNMQVFEEATNRTAVVVCEKASKSFPYPVPYVMWRGPSRIAPDKTLGEVLGLTKQSEFAAEPIRKGYRGSPWLTAPSEALKGLRKVIGKSDYKAYEGVNTGGLNGCYWLRVLKDLPDGNLFVENLHDVGKIKVTHYEKSIEGDLVYPLLRGRDVARWKAEPSAHILLAQDPDLGKGIPESRMKREYPKTYAYLKLFEGNPRHPERGTLRGRALFKKYFDPTDPFYSIYNVGPYTLSRWKVAWREQASSFTCAVVGSEGGKPVLPDHKLMFVPARTKAEGLYLSAVLNSAPVRLLVSSYVISTSTSTHVLSHVDVPKYDAGKTEHARLASLSQQSHRAAEQGNRTSLDSLEAEIDNVVAKLWNISKAELGAIQGALAATQERWQAGEGEEEE